jgi:hypothetical protein
MAGIKYQLSVIARGETRDAEKALARLENRAGKVSKRVRSGAMDMAKGFSLVGGAAGIGVAIAGFNKLQQTQRNTAQLNAVITSTGGAARVTAKQVTSLSSAIAKKTGVDDDAILSGQNMLLTFTQVQNRVGKGNDVFNQATRTMTDMSVALGIDARSAALQMGKALNDPVKGVTKLTRMGVTFTDQQKDQIKAMSDAGDVAGAQKVILAELNREFGGSAAAYGKTLPGQIGKATQAFEDFSMAIVARALPGITATIKHGMRFLTWTQNAAKQGGVLRPMIDGLSRAMTRIRTALVAAGQAFMTGFSGPSASSGTSARELSTSIGTLAAQVGAFVQRHLPPLAERLGQATRFLSDHRSTVVKTVVAAALLDKGLRGLIITLSAYGRAKRLATSLVMAYRKALWLAAAAGHRSVIMHKAMTVATKAHAVASRAAAVAQRLLNLALIANPVGLVIAALALLAGGLVLAYKRSDRFRSIVDKLWGWTKKLASKILEYKEYLLLLAGPAGALVLAYKKSDRFRDIVQRIVGKLREMGSTIKDTVLDTVSKLRGEFDKLLDKLRPVAETLGKIGGALGGIGRAGGRAAGALPGIGDSVIPGGQPAPRELLSRWGLQSKMANAVGLGISNGLQVTSGIRRGAITAAGLPSDHGDGSAVDLAGSKSAMARVYQLAGFLPNLKQRLYSPLDGWSDDHYDHVHIAMHAKGGALGKHGAGCDCAMHRLAKKGGRLSKPTVVDVAGEAGDEQIVPLSPRYRKWGLKNLQEAAHALGARVDMHARGRGSKKRKPKTLQQRFETGSALYANRSTTLDLSLARAEGTSRGDDDERAIAALSNAAQRRAAALATFLRKNGKRIKGQLRAEVQSGMAEALRAAQGFTQQLADMREQAQQAAAAASEASYTNRITSLEDELTGAERGGTGTASRDAQAGIVSRMADQAKARYDELKQKLSSKGLSKAARLETQAAMSEALRAYQGYVNQVTDLTPTLDERVLEVVQNLRDRMSWRSAVQDLQLAQAEMTEGTQDDVAAFTGMAASAREEYDSLIAQMQQAGLSEAARAEIAGAAADALRRQKQYLDQVNDLTTATAAEQQRALSENERRGLSLLGIKTQPGQTSVSVEQYFTAEPNMFAAAKGIQWALQGAAS